MINTKKINTEMKIPGIFAVIEESTLTADSTAIDVGKTPTIIVDAPDFIYTDDSEFSGIGAVKPVMLQDNVVYVIEDPSELLRTLRGESFIDGTLTKDQLESMRATQLENALEIATETNKKFAFVKMVKRDGTRPDMNNLFEIYQAYEYAKESLAVINVGTVVPFGTSIFDVFEIDEKDAKTSLTFSKGEMSTGTIYEKYHNFIFPNKYTLDIEKNLTGKLAFEIVDYGAENVGDISNEMEANIYYVNASGTKKLIAQELKVTYEGAFNFNPANPSIPAVVLRENTTLTVLQEEIEVVINSGTLIATIAKENDGKLITDSTGKLITNYDLSIATVDANTPIGDLQNVVFSAHVNKNPYVQVKSIIDEDYEHNIQILQGYDEENNVKNFDPEKADSLYLTFDLNTSKDKVNVCLGLGETKKVKTTASVTGSNGFYNLTEQVKIKVTNGVTAILPVGLKVYNEEAFFNTELAESIYYNLKYEVKNQPSYVINVVPQEARICDLWAEFAQNSTFELDETRVVLSSGLIGGDSQTLKQSYVSALEELKLRGSMKTQLSSTKVWDLGKYISIPVGSLKSQSGVGGYKADTSYRIKDFGRTNGGSGEIENETNIVILNKGASIRKGDLVEITTIKRYTQISKQNIVEDVSQLNDGTYKIILKNKVDTKKFNLSAYQVTFSLINKKDLKGNYLAFQYAIFSDEFYNKTPIRKKISGTAEITFPKDLIKRLDTAGYTVINYDPEGDRAFIENTPSMASDTNQFSDQIVLGTLFYIIKQLRAIGKSYEGINMNSAENQSSYTDSISKLITDVKTTKQLVTSISITPDFSKAQKGKISAYIKFTTAVTLKQIVYYTQINKTE